MGSHGLTAVLPPPKRGDAGPFAGRPFAADDRRAGPFHQVHDTYAERLRQDGTEGRFDRRRPIADARDVPAGARRGRRAGDTASLFGLHLKVSHFPEIVRHSAQFVAQAIGQDRATLNAPAREDLASGTAAYEAGLARTETLFYALEPVEVFA